MCGKIANVAHSVNSINNFSRDAGLSNEFFNLFYKPALLDVAMLTENVLKHSTTKGGAGLRTDLESKRGLSKVFREPLGH